MLSEVLTCDITPLIQKNNVYKKVIVNKKLNDIQCKLKSQHCFLNRNFRINFDTFYK